MKPPPLITSLGGTKARAAGRPLETTCMYDGRPARIDRIERTLELTGELDDTQRQRLLEIADRCPVHHSLAGDARVATRLVE